MALTLSDPELELEAQQLAERTGEPVVDALRIAVRERLDRVRPKASEPAFRSAEEIMALMKSFGDGPVNYDLTEDEILGYGPDGIPR
jgi:antitoxin VapB